MAVATNGTGPAQVAGERAIASGDVNSLAEVRRLRRIAGVSRPGLPPSVRKRARVACLIIPFALAAPVYALRPQKSDTQFTHTGWSAEDGIPGPVRAIAQTRDGYLWLATEAGLYRFDGLRFAPYEPSRSSHTPRPPGPSLPAAQGGGPWG